MNFGRYYTFRASNGISVTMLRGSSAAKMTQGGGNWTTISRPRRVAMVRWVGRDPYGMDVPVMFDGWAGSDSVETGIAKLNQMQMSPGDLIPPPTVHIDGAVPIKGAVWVISSIDWGDNVIWAARGEGGHRLRQDAVVHLLQYVPEKLLRVGAPNLAMGGTYVVKSGDTVKSITKYWYGDISQMKLVMNANGLRDSNKLKVGTRLRMPVASEPSTYAPKKPTGRRAKKSTISVRQLP